MDHTFHEPDTYYMVVKKSTAKIAIYGSGCVTIRTCVKKIIDLRTALKYLDVTSIDQSQMFGDNESNVNSSLKTIEQIYSVNIDHTTVCGDR